MGCGCAGGASKSVELDRHASGLAAFMLSFSTLVTLKNNGTLSDDELADIVKQSLRHLKAIDAAPSVRSQAARESALALLEQVYACLSRDVALDHGRSKRQHGAEI
jgi:hypothetical protein